MPITTGQITITDLNDGQSLYTWVRYADTPTTGISTSPTNKTYIGLAYNKTSPTATNTYSDYTWSLIKGTDGSDGVPGPPGADGQTSYLHTAYATNATGTSGFSTTVTTGKTYIGTYTDFTAADSTDPTKYKWVLIQGPQGSPGATGSPGQNAIMGILSNDAHVCPADSAGNVSTFAGAVVTMSVYVGTADDSANWTVTAAPSSGVTGTLSGKTYTISGFSAANDTGFVDLTATRSGYASITRRFSLSKAKQGSTGAAGSPGSTGSPGQNATAYWLISSVPAIAKSAAGVYTPTSITFTGRSQTGTGTPGNYTGRFLIHETTDGTNWVEKYRSAANEATKAHTPAAGIKAVRVQFYLAGAFTTMLDEQVISIVADGSDGVNGSPGAKGDPGEPGQNAIMGILSNDAHVFPADTSGNVTSFAGAAVTMSVYVGITNDSANWAVTAAPSTGVTGTLSGKTYTVTGFAAANDTGFVDLTATRSGYASITRRFSVTKSKQGSAGSAGSPGSTGSPGQNATAYWLISSVPAIAKSITGAYTPTTITFSGRSQTGTGTPAAYAGRFVIHESTDGVNWGTAKYQSAANEASRTHTPAAGIKAIRCQFYLAGGVVTMLDEQVISIVSDGATGDPGPRGAEGDEATLMNVNPSFYDWFGTLPSGYGTLVGSHPLKVVSGNGTGNSAQYSVSSGSTERSFGQTITSRPYVQYIYVESTFKLTAGSLSGSGARFTVNATSPTEVHLNFASLVTSPVLDKYYTVSRVVKLPSASTPEGFTSYTATVCGAWSGFGSITLKTIQIDSIKIRPATDSEIAGYASQERIEDWTAPNKTTINGAKIEAYSITAQQIKADAIDGKVINGATINLVDQGVIKAVDSSKATGGVSTFWVDKGLLKRAIVDPLGNGFLGFFDGDAADFKGFIGSSSQGYITAAGMMKGTSDSLTYLDLANLEVGTLRAKAIESEGRKSPSLQNGWTQYMGGFTYACYYKDPDGIVHITGLLKPGTTAQGTTLFTLPTNYRPSGTELFYVHAATAGGVRVDVNNAGEVKLNSSGVGSFLSLAGISFKAEA